MRKILLFMALLSATLLSAKMQKSISTFNLSSMDPVWCLGDLYPQQIYGDQKLDSIVYVNNIGGEDINTYLFDGKGHLTNYIYESISKYYQIVYSYDDNGFCSQSVAQMPNPITGEWTDSRKAEFKRDAQGRQTQGIHSCLSGGIWYPEQKFEIVYDAQGCQAVTTEYEYQSEVQAWQIIYISKNDYTYNEQGLPTKYVYSTWNPEDGWANDYMVEYEYDEQGRETYSLESYWNSTTSAWEQRYETTTAYSTDNGIVYGVAAVKKWNSDTNQWESEDLIEFQYDENGNETLYTVHTFNDSQWELHFKRTSSYDNNGRLILMEEEYPAPAGTYKSEYMYDDFGNKVAEIITNAGESIKSYRWYFNTISEEGINQLTNHQSPITNKILRNGQLLILRGNKTYTATGQEVKL